MIDRGPTPSRTYPCADVAAIWEAWCGETPWSRLLRRCGELGAVCEYWCGVPRSASAIPLTFAIYKDGKKVPAEQSYRLKDLRAAVAFLEGEHDLG